MLGNARDAVFRRAAEREASFLPGERQGLRYPLIGAVLACGAPMGLLGLRRLLLGDRYTIREEIRRDLPTYVYLTVATTFVFAVFGRVVGLYAEQLAELSTTDSLTGLLNARAFYARLEQELERSRRSGQALTLILLDLDNLKALNDEHGHATGDNALRALGLAIRREMRATDIGARLGGDEFGLLAVGSAAEAGHALAARLHAAIADEMRRRVGLNVTASIGLVAFEPSRHGAADGHAVHASADRALYEAKRAGRNRVVLGRLHSR
jgi:diguanylate cyclase (GGDEF)-like protein